jgi:hypothetical protein
MIEITAKVEGSMLALMMVKSLRNQLEVNLGIKVIERH